MVGREAVIAGALRTPYGRREGALGSWHPVDLGAYLLSGAAARYGLAPGDVQDVLLGCVSQVGAQAGNLARNAVLAAGWPEEVCGATVDGREASSARAVHWAVQAVRSGAQDLVLAGGVEVMSAVPPGAALAVPNIGKPYSPALRARYDRTASLLPPSHAVEEVARRWHLSRQRLDDWSVSSHLRAAVARDQPSQHVLAVPLGPRRDGGAGASGESHERRGPEGTPRAGWLAKDEVLGPPLSPEDAAAFAPLFVEGGVATAANVAPEGDGAAVLLVASANRARALKLAPLARFVSFAVAGTDPSIWPTATILATRRALEEAKLCLDDVDYFEVHESSAAAVLAWLDETGADPALVNARGGALARTSPHGAVGAGLFVEAVEALVQRGQGRALVSVAGEGGVATACVIERS
ncbi:MAG: thiolase family protein [Acidimicrobiales bacterium]